MKRIAIKFDSKAERMSVELAGLAKRDAELCKKLEPIVLMLRQIIEVPSIVISRTRSKHGA